MRIEILVIGREMLTGRTLDKNSNWIARTIFEIGGEVARIVCVDDTVDDITNSIVSSKNLSTDVLITTGGLGPTVDDLTLEAVSITIDQPLELHAEALGLVTERYGYFYDMGYVDSPDINDSRRKMAVLPRTAEILPNRVGAAPGVSVEYGGMNIFVLPGVPKEMQAIFDEFVLPYLALIIGGVYQIEEKLLSGCKDESALRPVLDDAMDMFKNVRIKPAPESFGADVNIPLIISASGNDMDEIKEYVEKVKTYLMGKLKEIKK